MTTTPNAPKAAAPEVAEADMILVPRASLADALEFIEHYSHAWNGVSARHPNTIATNARAALDATPQRVAAWMPIETAPKDGTAIYVVVANALKPEAGVAHWFSDTWRGGQDIDWHGTENPHEHFGVYPSPTHWQPLPASPSQASATGGV